MTNACYTHQKHIFVKNKVYLTAHPHQNEIVPAKHITDFFL